ncbi:hypothetical protein PILCRDRAFT_737 [Piloderma croceum F 1598]|uniref:Uncharacterized protein n=1 Tax=Piloderma croceum (strain F 1598) TaxID=765440 RepID=A0A0C3BYF5_PILCF|nr:hypothetical protein PILCRDRAFT_737 [Piloderma croceum F 1598]
MEVPLEEFYDKPGPIKVYTYQVFGEKVLLRVTHVSESHPRVTVSKPLKWTYKMLDINADAIL